MPRLWPAACEMSASPTSFAQPAPECGKNCSPEPSASGSSTTAVTSPLHAMMTAVVDFIRLGALSVKSGAGGLMYFDEFESRILP